MTASRKRPPVGSTVHLLEELATIPFLLADVSGHVIAANDAVSNLLGRSRRRLLSSTLSDLLQQWNAVNPIPRSGTRATRAVQRRKLHIPRKGRTFVDCWLRAIRRQNGDVLLVFEPIPGNAAKKQRRRNGVFDPINALIESNHEFFGVADLNTTVRYINRAGRIMCGLPAVGPLPKMKILDTIPDFFHSQFLEEIVPAVRRDGRWHGPGWLRRFDTNADLPVEVDVFTVLHPGTHRPGHIATVIRDRSEREQAELTLRRHTEELTAIHLLSTQVNASLSIDRVIEAAMEGIRTAVQADRLFVYLHEGERYVLRNKEFDFAVDPAERETEFSVAETLCNRAVHQKKSLFLSEIKTGTGVPDPEIGNSTIRAFAALILHRGANALGVIGIASYSGFDYEGRAPFLEAIADTISIGLTNAMLFTSTKEAGEALRKSEERFRTLVERTSEAIFVQTNLRFAYLNDEAVKLFGATSADQLIGRPIIDRIHPDYRDFVRQRVARMNEAKVPVPISDMMYLRVDGSPVSVESAAAPITFGGTEGSVVFAFDIEGRRTSERAVRESEERLKRAQAVAHVGNWELDLHTLAIWGSDEAFRIYGVDRTTALLTLAIVQHSVLKEYRTAMDRALRLLIEEGIPYEQEFQITRVDDGRVRFVYSKAELMRDTDGKPARVLGVIQDITDRKKTEADLVESEKRWHAVFDNSGIGIVLIDSAGFPLQCNRAFEHMLGYEEEELRHILFTDLSHPDDAAKDFGFAGEILDGKRERYQIEKRYFTKDGRMLWANLIMSALHRNAGTERLSIGLLEDITERKRSEQALRQSEYFLRKSQDVARIGSYYLDAATGEWSSSPVLDDIFGIPASYTRDVAGWLAIIHPDQREEMQGYFTNDVMGLHHRFDRTYRIIRIGDGKERWVHGQGELELDDRGNTSKMIGTIQDITERMEHELAIVAALREKEILLKEIHHRVKNNMQVISSLLSLQGSTIDDPAMKTLVFESMNRIRSMALVHERLYKANNLASIDFRDYLSSMASELSRSLPRNDIAVRVEAESMQVGVDLAIPCGLIANELISNAFKHAFPDGRPGTVEVSLRTLPEHRAELRVRDDGVGSSSNTEGRSGETLGMMIIDALVEQIAGRLTTERHDGTSVVVEFPIS